jgi:putative hydrolase of the HAD superfamily
MTSASTSEQRGGRTVPLWPRPEALLLDAMGTLIGLRASVGTSYAEAAAGHGIDVDAAAIDRAFPQVLRQAPSLAFPGLSGEALLAAERRWWGERIESVLQAAGAPGAPLDLQHQLFDRFADPSLWRVYDDVPDRLARWHHSGLRLAVVSNFDQRLHGLLEGLALARWMDLVVVSSQAGAAKPSPEPFRQALAGLGLGPDQAWHVGDSPEDAEGARAAGLRCLLVRRS